VANDDGDADGGNGRSDVLDRDSEGLTHNFSMTTTTTTTSGGVEHQAVKVAAATEREQRETLECRPMEAVMKRRGRPMGQAPG
jgi:hypothetical protein